MTRTDIHSVRNADYTRYEFVACFYIGGNVDMIAAYGPQDEYQNAMRRAREAGKLFNAGNGGCDHCGAIYAHGVMLRHVDSGEYIRIGHQCADNFGQYPDAKAARNDVNRRVRQIKRENAWQAKSAADRAAVLAANPGLAEALETEHRIVGDVAARFLQYGRISDKQIELVLKLAADVWTPVREYPSAPVVEGKGVAISGEVVATKWHEGAYGEVYKMIVRDDRGFKVWGSVPAKLMSIRSGARVTFVANVEKSRDDANFGFFKRPRKVATGGAR